MAIAFDAATAATAETGASGTVDWSHTVTGTNPYLVVYPFEAIVTDSDSITGVTYNGVAMTRIQRGDLITATYNQRLYCYGLAGPATGAHTISISYSSGSASDNHAAVAKSYTGISQASSTPDSSAQSAAAGASSPKNQATTVVASGCWLTGCHTASVNPAAGTGTTERLEDAQLLYMNAADSNAVVGPGSQALQWTWTGTANIHDIVLSLAPAATATTSYINAPLLGAG